MGLLRCGHGCRVVVAIAVLCALTGACAARSGLETDPEARDLRITAEVLRIIGELDDDDVVVAEDVRVETTDGVVVLSGVQPSLEAVGAILQRVARIRGVAEVVNRIRVVRTGGLAPWVEPSNHAQRAHRVPLRSRRREPLRYPG